MSFTPEILQTQIPYYLTQEAKENLVKALANFPQNKNYYTNLYQNYLLQGGGWSCLALIRIEAGLKKSVKGIIISNSCDIDNNNDRQISPNVIFSPIIKLNSYLDLLQNEGLNSDSVQNKTDAIREQKITSLFYLPKGPGLEENYVAPLDDLYTLSISNFSAGIKQKKLFTLSPFGFYIFLFKLSVHFCRFHENVDRG
jgi:hypothetical protein